MRGFRPFAVRLVGGEVIVVNAPFRGVAMKRWFAVTTDGETMRHIPLEEIESVSVETAQ